MSDESEDHLRKQLVDAFGHDDIYVILGVTKDSSAAEIKKSYMKLALTHHPDKGGETSKFQALCLAHAILSDPEKRKLYDSNGFMSTEDGLSDESFAFWHQYFRNLFPEVTTADIDSFGVKYIGSEEEKRDIQEAYDKYKGNLQNIMDSVMFAEAGEEQRIINVIDGLIEGDQLRTTKKYTASRAAVLTNCNKENSKKNSSSSSSKEKNKRKRTAHDGDGEEGKEKEKEGDNDALIAAMRQRQQNRNKNIMSSILSHLSPDELMQVDDVPDDEFERIRVGLEAFSSAKKNGKGRK